MKLNTLTTVGIVVIAFASAAQGAKVSISDVTILPGEPRIIEVPILISPGSEGEMISGLNISFTAGVAGDAIPIVDADPLQSSIGTPEEFDGSIWDPTYFGASGTPAVHAVFSTVARAAVPLQVLADGTIITYTLDTTALPLGTYLLDPNHIDPVSGVGTSAFLTGPGGGIVPVPLTFDAGMLNIVPEPTTATLLGALVVTALVATRRSRRGMVA